MYSNDKFRRLFRLDNDHGDVARAVDDELQFHFELSVRELMAKGLSEVDAKREAERRFGDVERTRKGLTALDNARVTETRRSEWWSNLLQDTRYALRGLRRKPGFTIAVVIILALGIGANATMFGIVDQLLWRAPSFLSNPNRVQRLYFATLENGQQQYGTATSYLAFHDVVDSLTTADAATAYWSTDLAVGISDPHEMSVTYATSSFWKFFNARPVVGRFFGAAEDVVANPAQVAVLEYAFWQRTYGGSDSVIGKSLRLGKIDYTIIGVAPRGFIGFDQRIPVAYVPLPSGAMNSFAGNGRSQWYSSYGFTWMRVLIRRNESASVAATTAELSTRFAQSYAKRLLKNPSGTPLAIAKPRVVVSPVQTARGPIEDTNARVTVWLVGVAFIVLIIACANVSNLLLARALKRRREIAVRLALGISRSRLLAQLLVESLLLALLAACAGLLIAAWGGPVLRASLLPNVAMDGSLADTRTLIFTGSIALAAGLLAGLAPAVRAGRSNLSQALRSGSREGTYQHSRFRTTMLVMQATLSVVLLVGAGLFVRSLNNVQSVRLGYDANQLAYVHANLRGVKFDTTHAQLLYDDIMRTATGVPGVQSAAFAAMVPFQSEWSEELFVSGIDSVSTKGDFLLQVVSPGYFETMGTRIVQGRALTSDDRPGAPLAIVISENMAKKLWPGRNAIGQCIRVLADTVPCSFVVGIAENVKYTSLMSDGGLQYYLPLAQANGAHGALFANLADGLGGVFVRTSSTSPSAEAIRKAVQRVMPGASYVTVTPFSVTMDEVRRSWQMGATMFTLFGVLALLVASVGLYSVIAYSVAQRTQEMGVRVALGAQKSDVLRLVLSDAVTSALLAVVLGSGGALLASKWIAPLLFETSAHDPVVYVGVAVTLIAVALVAGVVPALRAAKVDPSTALRAD